MFIKFERVKTIVSNYDCYIIYGIAKDFPRNSRTQLHITTFKDVSDKAWEFILKNEGNEELINATNQKIR